MKDKRRPTKICACNANLETQYGEYWDRNRPYGFLLMDEIEITGRLVMNEQFYNDCTIVQYDVMQDWLFDMRNEFDKMQKRYDKEWAPRIK